MEAEEVTTNPQETVPTEVVLNEAETYSASDDDDDALSIASEELEISMEERMGLIPDNVELTAEQRLAWWFSQLPNAQADVCEELGGNDSCLINVESLILRFAFGKEYSNRFVSQPNFLHLFYAIEKFLASLNEVGIVNFHLIFFDALKGLLMHHHAGLWAFREAFRAHCTQHAHVLPHKIFQSWHDDQYKTLLSTTHPFVFILEDSSFLESPQSAFSEDDEVQQPAEHGYAALYSLILDSVGHQLNVSFLYRMNRAGRRIKAFTIGPERYHAATDSLTAQQSLQLAEDSCARVQEYVHCEPWTVSQFEQTGLPLRLALFARAAADIIGDSSEDAWSVLFFKVLMLHDFALRKNQLRQRALNLATVDNEQYRMTLEFFFAYAQELIASLLDDAQKMGVQAGERFDMTELLDMIDEGLIRAVLFSLSNSGSQEVAADFFGIDAEWESQLENAWNLLGQPEKFFPIKLSEVMSEEDSVLEGLPATEDNKEKAQGMSGKARFLEIRDNDFINQTVQSKDGINPALMEIESESRVDEGDTLVASYFEDEQRLIAKPLMVTGDEQPKPPVYSAFKLDSEFDLAAFHATSHAEKKQEYVPRWIEKLSGENRERALRRWQMRKAQEAQVFARNINKYFGSLDRLHKPIVLVGGHAAASHPWMNEPVREEEEESKVKEGKTKDSKSKSKESKTKEGKSKESKETKSKETKLSSKAAAIIAKNQAVLAEKKKSKEGDVVSHLNSQMDHMFRKKTSRLPAFNEAFMELLVGSRNASDSSVLEDFTYIAKSLTLSEYQLDFVTTIAQKLMQPLEHTWRLRTITESQQTSAMLHTVGLVFRFVQIAVDKYLPIMSASQVQTFETLLLMLGFDRSARLVFESWAECQWQAKVNKSTEPAAAVSEKDKKKAGKPGSKSAQKEGKKDGAKEMDEKQKKSYFAKLEKDGWVGKVTKRSDFAVRSEIESTVQLQYLGADLKRSLGSKPDHRVAFMPDYWQKRLLDAVDNLQSCLVVAPTASGKTFVCYYAMDQALRYDNDRCVIFISPTRALALQVEAEVIARFSGKTYPSGSKTVLCGHLYEDRAENWMNCQILITVPSALQAVLTSTDKAIMSWQQKLAYAIMDEVHCIGDEKMGRACENLIQLLPCPFMALSATIGNEQAFSSWLSKAQSFPGARPITFIKHDERYADLESLYYSSTEHSLFHLNPLLTLDYSRVKAHALTGEFDLIPNDCLQTYKEVARALTAKLAGSTDTVSPADRAIAIFFVEQFNPEVYFTGTRAITKRQYRCYLHSVLHSVEAMAIRNLIDEHDYESILDNVAAEQPLDQQELPPWWKVQKTTTTVRLTHERPKSTDEDETHPAVEEHKTETSSTAGGAATLGDVLPDAGQALHVFNDPDEFLKLIRKLEARKLMPALVFNFNRAFASRLFYRLVNKLIDEHRNKYYGTPEAILRTKALNKQREDEYKAELARREMAEKWKSLSKQQREEQGIDDALIAELAGPAPPAPLDVAQEHDPEFFLCDRKMYVSSQEETEAVFKLCRIEQLVKNNRISPLLVEALRRGIGLYHDALHREYRRAVEFLFRMRYLRVVVSDVALSLGVNMPCKSTIFAGDSPMLTPLLFRQTAGRAGRRGFDSLGHIVFWEFPFKKIRRLLCSRVAMLSGNYSAKPTTVLRAIKLAQTLEADCLAQMLAKKGAAAAFDRATFQAIDASRAKLTKLFTAPLFAVGTSDRVLADLQENIRVSFRAAADLLRRLGLLTTAGQPGAFSAIAMALGDDELANLFLPYCLLRGVLRDLEPATVPGDGSEPVVSPEDLNKPLLHLLSFVMRRRDFTHSIVRRFELAQISKECESILLPGRSSADLLSSQTWSPLLPPLAPETYSLAEQFDRKVLDNAVARARAMALAKEENDQTDYSLPITSVLYQAELPTGNSPFDQFLMKTRKDVESTFYLSPFTCGIDNVGSVEELLLGVRDCVYLEAGLIPQLTSHAAEISLGAKSIEMPLVNSYVAATLQHGSLRHLIQSNSIPASEAYHVVVGLKEAFARLSASLASHTEPVGQDPLNSDSSTNIAAHLKQIGSRCAAVHSGVKV